MIIIIRLVGNDAVVGNERIGRVPKTAIGTREYLGGTLAASSYVKETWHRLFVTGNNASGYLQSSRSGLWFTPYNWRKKSIDSEYGRVPL